jgi:hypothetical protein
MKALFLMFHGFDKANGISKKIHYQVKALKECGLDVRTCYYQTTPNGERRWIIDDEVIADSEPDSQQRYGNVSTTPPSLNMYAARK